MTSEEIEKLLQPTIEGLGYELSDLELKTGGRDGLLRVFIDSPDGIGLEDCEKVSLQVSAWLDVEDPISGEYSLEVSSPGLDRRLKTAAHFGRFVGEVVSIKLYRANEGRRRYKGPLVAATDSVVTVEVDGVPVELGMTDIEMARLVPDPKNIGQKPQG